VRKYSDEGLLGELDLDELLAGSHHVLVLDTHDTTAPLSVELVVIIVLGLELLGELLEIDEVLAAHLGQSHASGRLEVNELAKVGLAADEAEGNTLLSAEGGQMDDELDRVDVVSDDNKLGLVLLDEGGHVVEAELKVERLVTLFGVGLVGGTALSVVLQSKGLLLVGLWLVLGEQFKELAGLVLLESRLELIDGGGHLQSLHQDSLLPLDANVLGPFDEPSQVALRLDVSSNTEVASALLEEGSSASRRGTCLGLNDLLSFRSFLHHND